MACRIDQDQYYWCGVDLDSPHFVLPGKLGANDGEMHRRRDECHYQAKLG